VLVAVFTTRELVFVPSLKLAGLRSLKLAWRVFVIVTFQPSVALCSITLY